MTNELEYMWPDCTIAITRSVGRNWSGSLMRGGKFVAMSYGNQSLSALLESLETKYGRGSEEE